MLFLLGGTDRSNNDLLLRHFSFYLKVGGSCCGGHEIFILSKIRMVSHHVFLPFEC